MKISLLLTATNPLSLKYLTFFATLSSWYQHVDEIIIADGGTTDETYEKIDKSILDKIKIVKNKNTHWDIFNGFSPNHINSMLNEGINECKNDWLIIIGSDFVLKEFDRKSVEEKLKKYSTENWVRFRRYKLKSYNANQWENLEDNRGAVILNMKKIRELTQFPLIMGLLDTNNIIYDYPIFAKKFASIKYNQTGPVIIPKGLPLTGGNKTISEIKVFVSDHFFYDKVLAKKQRKLFFEYFNARVTASALLSNYEIDQKILKSKNRIPHKELINLDVPKEFHDIVKKYLTDDCLGNFRDLKIKKFTYAKISSYLIRKLKTKILKSKGFISIIDYMDWTDDVKQCKVNDLNLIYKKQDKYF